MDLYPISSKSLEKFYYIDGDQLGQQYKDHLSDFHQWEQKEHADQWIIFPENIGPKLSIDETSPSNGELYTVVTNKDAHGKKGALVAIISGVQSEHVISIINKIPFKYRQKVIEITLDMANTMNLIVKRCFPNAERIIDRFHVQKLAYDALQEMRIAHRWDAINEETDAIQNAKLDHRVYTPEILPNGDTKKLLLFRSRYLLFKSPEKWTPQQSQRAKILFDMYPDIRKAYWLVHKLRVIYNTSNHRAIAYKKLALWFNEVTDSGFKSFNTISATIYSHYNEILNYFNNRSTNASAESFNAKIKKFRTALHGVRDLKFFFFRLAKIYA